MSENTTAEELGDMREVLGEIRDSMREIADEMREARFERLDALHGTPSGHHALMHAFKTEAPAHWLAAEQDRVEWVVDLAVERYNELRSARATLAELTSARASLPPATARAREADAAIADQKALIAAMKKRHLAEQAEDEAQHAANEHTLDQEQRDSIKISVAGLVFVLEGAIAEAEALELLGDPVDPDEVEEMRANLAACLRTLEAAND